MPSVNGEKLALVVAGHVDHGKSTLIGRLLLDTGSVPEHRVHEIISASGDGKALNPAFITDSLEEERDGEVTIDTTEVFLRVSSREYAIIDTPGHSEFVKNMITGASRGEFALLVVDVNEGIREQTRSHVGILRMLGIKQIVTAVNKMDLVGFARERFDALVADVKGLLRGFDVKAVVPVAALEGDNIVHSSSRTEWYDGPAILEAIGTFSLSEPQATAALRMAIQGKCVHRGEVLYAGRIGTGCLHVGDRVVFRPSDQVATVASIRGDGQAKEIQTAEAGRSVGFTITAIAPVGRGEVVCREDERIPVSSDLSGCVFAFAKRALVNGEKLRLRCGTQEVGCTICRIDQGDHVSDSAPAVSKPELREGEFGTVTLRSERPIAAERFQDAPGFGRFVLLRGHDVVAAGLVEAVGDH